MSPEVFFDVCFAAAALLVAVYVGWQLMNLGDWRRRPPDAKDRKDAVPARSVAVVVPFRNEAANLPALWASLAAQDYAGPLEYVFVDDHSTDGGALLLPPPATVLRLADYPPARTTLAHKKAALTYAIGSTTADLIVTTDADCVWPTDGVRRLVAQTDSADVVLGPVLVAARPGFCAAFQGLDLAAYQFLTAATARRGRPVLANGACFAFRRAAFVGVGGYAGVDHLPSGDDVLLLHKFLARTQVQGKVEKEQGQARPGVSYSPTHHAVLTRPVAGWRALWRQRLRWAGKAGSYTEPGLVFAQGLTFAVCAALVTALVTYPLHLRPRPLLLLWGTKALVDGLCLAVVLRYYGQTRLLRWYPLAAVVYPFFLVGVGTAALLGLRSPWKDRPGRPAGKQ